MNRIARRQAGPVIGLLVLVTLKTEKAHRTLNWLAPQRVPLTESRTGVHTGLGGVVGC